MYIDTEEIIASAAAVGLVVFLVALVALLALSAVWSAFPVTTATIAVADKEFADDTYLIWSDSGDVYRVDDSVLSGRYDSSNDYFRIKIGSTYDVVLRGRRVPVLSMYPNIAEFTLVGTGE